MEVYKLSAIFLLICPCFGYISERGLVVEKTFKLVSNFPNTLRENVSEFNSVRIRINPGLILKFNATTTMVRFEFKVDEDTPSKYPVFISLIQRHENILIRLPYSYPSKYGLSARYTTATRTICFDGSAAAGDIIVEISTGSTQIIGIKLKALVDDMGLKLNHPRSFAITPLEPAYFRIPFHENSSQNLRLKVTSNNGHCMAIGIQQPRCPVFPPEENFYTHGSWKVFSSSGSVIVDMKDYLKGFFVKLVVLHDESLCGKMFPQNPTRKWENVTIVLENSLPVSIQNGKFLFQMLIPAGASLLIGVVMGSMYLIIYACSRRKTYDVNKTETGAVSVEQFTPIENRSQNYGKWSIIIFILSGLPFLENAIYNGLLNQGATGLFGMCSYSSPCSHDFWIFKDFNHLWSNVCYFILGTIFLLIAGMKNCMKKQTEPDPEGIQFYPGLYYAMGVGLIVNGILSLAYHFCPSKAYFQYDILYFAFIIGVCQLKLTESRRPQSVTPTFSCGALAAILLLVNLGIGTERYFPEKSFEITNFVFRIIVGTVQGIFILYASVYAIYIGYPVTKYPKKTREETPLQNSYIVNGVPNANAARSDKGKQQFMKSMADIPRCLWIFPKIWHWKLPRKFQAERCLYVIMLLALNGFLIYFLLTANLCLYIFAFLGANFLLNLLYYVMLKILFGELSCSWKSLQFLIFLLLAAAAGTGAGYFFFETMKDWSDPRSESSMENDACIWMNPFPFYDKHDTFHILGAHAFFFLFMVLLSIDDGVENVNQEYLLAF